MSQSLDLAGQRVLVVGLAREGSALARHLALRQVTVTGTDLRPEKDLAETVRALTEAVRLAMGGHDQALLEETDLLFVSPGVPLDSPFIAAARERGLPLSTESRLFCQLCPAPVIGLTGSSGKTTTASLVGQMLVADGRKTWVGGNIGRPLIDELGQIQSSHWVVLELSSFQLAYFRPALNAGARIPKAGLKPLFEGWSPPVATVLNVTPNHLDRHGSMVNYIEAKQAILDFQRPGDQLILNLDDEVTRQMGHGRVARVSWFSQQKPVERGAFLRNQQLVLRANDREIVLCQRDDVPLRGQHNVANVLAACAIAATMGVVHEAMVSTIRSFRGVEHRLELVRDYRGVHYYNDSIATSPERLAAALCSFDESLILLAGGRDKHLPWNEAARLIRERVRHLILFGEAMQQIARAVENAAQEIPAGPPEIHRCVGLEDAVQIAAQLAHPGEVVLLSPGCTSFDAFRDFAARGERFRELVGEL
jgi:UDP-N-acetylmuramoylalanine--D-glutamate ligase